LLIPPHVFCGPDADGVVTIRGEIDMSSLEDLTQRFASLPDPLLLDLSQVEFIDCSGIGILVAERRRRDRDIPLRIVATSPAVDRLLVLTGVKFRVAAPLPSVN
jgi:anti-anti-sigma factor